MSHYVYFIIIIFFISFFGVYVYQFVILYLCNVSISTMGNQLDEHYLFWLPAVLYCIANIIMIVQFFGK